MKISDKKRIEIKGLANDAKDTLEQIKLCLYNGSVIEDVSKKELKTHLKNLRAIASLINKEIETKTEI